MTRQGEFLIMLVISTICAMRWGGRPERIGAATLFIGAVLSAAVVSPIGERFHHVEIGILLADMALLGIFIWLSLRSPRYWPISIGGILAAEVLIHLGSIAAPHVHWLAYMNATVLWGWAAQTVIVIATLRHRYRLVDQGADALWKS